jgi:hypothetical protein
MSSDEEKHDELCFGAFFLTGEHVERLGSESSIEMLSY